MKTKISIDCIITSFFKFIFEKLEKLSFQTVILQYFGGRFCQKIMTEIGLMILPDLWKKPFQIEIAAKYM